MLFRPNKYQLQTHKQHKTFGILNKLWAINTKSNIYHTWLQVKSINIRLICHLTQSSENFKIPSRQTFKQIPWVCEIGNTTKKKNFIKKKEKLNFRSRTSNHLSLPRWRPKRWGICPGWPHEWQLLCHRR